MRYQLWQGTGCVVDMECDAPTSDNKLADFVKSVQFWLRNEPSTTYRVLIGGECIE